MGVESYFAAPDDGPRLVVADLLTRLSARGFSCREELDEWGHRVVFDGRESFLDLPVTDGAAVFATFDTYDDPLEFLEGVTQVFEEAGWITGEE